MIFSQNPGGKKIKYQSKLEKFWKKFEIVNFFDTSAFLNSK